MDLPVEERPVFLKTTHLWSRLYQSVVTIHSFFTWQPIDYIALGATTNPFVISDEHYAALCEDMLYTPVTNGSSGQLELLIGFEMSMEEQEMLSVFDSNEQ